MKPGLSFFDPVFNYVDSGKLFRQPFMWLYYIIGILEFVGCIWAITYVFDYIRYLNGGAYVFAILMVIACLAAGIFSLFFWFKRTKKIKENVPEHARFLAIPAVSTFIIHCGECNGIVVGFLGFCFGIFAAILLPITGNGGDFFLIGICIAIVSLIVGYLIILFNRLLGESIFAIGAIANDVHHIKKNTNQEVRLEEERL